MRHFEITNLNGKIDGKKQNKIIINMKKIYQKGITLYLTIVILAIILSIVLGLSSIVVNQTKITSGMGNSVISFYAAETGAERVLQVIYKSETPAGSYSSRPGEFFSNDVSYEVKVLINGE